MSEESMNDQLRAERQRKRRKRTSRNMEDANDTKAAPNTERVVMQDYRSSSAQGRTPSSGNSNSLELSDDRKSKPRRSRKRAAANARQNHGEPEEGEHTIERKGHRRPNKPRMNRSVSEEVLDIQREMDEAQLGMRRMPNTNRKHDHGTSNPMTNDHNSTLQKHGGETRRPKPKRNKPKPQRLSRFQNTSAEEENYQGDLDDEASFCGGFKVDKEDIVLEDSSASKGPPPIISTSAAANSPSLLPSQPLDVLFIERKDGGFKKEHKDKIAAHEAVANQPPVAMQREPTTSDFAMSTHRAFKVFALLCHGLLAGFALCQCLFVYSLSNNTGGTDNFLQNYYQLSQPIGSIYYFLLAVCTVSVFDSYGMVKSKAGFCHGFLSNPTRALALIVYVLALIFTLSVTMIDDRISLYKVDATLWDKTKDKENLLDDWKIINLMRGLGSVLGWLLLAMQPRRDSVQESLFDERDVNGEKTTNVKTATNHVLGGCNIGPHTGGYRDISP